MKKLFNYLLVIALVFGMGMPFVNAEGYGIATGEGYGHVEGMSESGDIDAEATVGNTQSPIYEVGLSWKNFVFDWKYDYESMTYDWVKHRECTPVDNLDLYDDYAFYFDAACTEGIGYKEQAIAHLEDEPYVYYWAEQGYAEVTIMDYSSGGYVTPSLQWLSEEKYEGTKATFSYLKKEASACEAIAFAEAVPNEPYLFTSSDCTGKRVAATNENVTYYELVMLSDVEIELDGEDVTLPRSAASNVLESGNTVLHIENRNCIYYVKLELHHQYDVGNYTVPTPAVGDTIGTVTITIETH